MDVDSDFYEINDVYRSWADSRFNFTLADESNGRRGFRRPQRAAAFAIFSHLDSEPERPAMIVMPTGTGKTDTIFSVIIAGLFKRTLLVVPSDTLRSQIGNRLEELVTLRTINAISDDMLSPVVHWIRGGQSALDTESIDGSNVAITTPAALAQLGTDDLARVLEHFSHLIFDEAHHVAAATWERIRTAFGAKPTFYFTATPFRVDQQRLNGKIVFNYSLRRAQRDNYFQKIDFYPVREYLSDEIDRTIATKAVDLLLADLDAGLDHILLARCSSISKANKVVQVYRELADNLQPLVIHSKSKNRTRDLHKILARESRVVVCVDMFGEGFDLPQLKVAAIHDQHQSPAVTLQFIGRLTRTDATLGAAKFVANIANQQSDGPMQRLYEESADWSSIIREVSSQRIGRELQRQAFEAKFEGSNDGERIVALNPTPNLSSVAYRVERDHWRPEGGRRLSRGTEELQLYSVSEDEAMVIAVTKQTLPVHWAQSDSIRTTTWQLYLAYYREADSTLFVSCTSDDRQRNRFLALVAGESRRIDGDDIFRVMYGINRLKLQNVGLSRAGRDVRFTMHVGQDVNRVMDDLENGRSIKSNIFGTGFADGDSTTAGCSSKGKVWKMESSTLDEWVRWCDLVASKLNDPHIDTAAILNNVMRAEKIAERWPSGVFFADWPDAIGVETEGRCAVTINTVSYHLLDLKLGRPTLETETILAVPLIEEARGGDEQQLLTIRVCLLTDGYSYRCGEATIQIGSQQHDLGEYLNRERLRFLQADGSIIVGNYRYYTNNSLNVPLPRSLISTWNWEAVDISKESMSSQDDFGTVQGFTYQKIVESYDIVFNDDGPREVADLIAIREMPDRIDVDLYHCKYCSSGDSPGARVNDAYAVVGQASRSVKWLHRGPTLFKRLLHRYDTAQQQGVVRLLKGAPLDIDRLKQKSRDVEMRMGFFIVQPAFSQQAISTDVLSVLGTTYMYIKDIAGVDLKLICSP